MKKIFLCSLLISLTSVHAQIGVNTELPQAVFHVDGKGNDPVNGTTPNTSQQLDDFVITKEGRVGIGTIAPYSFSSVEIASKMPILLPRLAKTADRNELPGTTPGKNGLILYNLETNCLSYWIESNWIEVCNDLVQN